MTFTHNPYTQFLPYRFFVDTAVIALRIELIMRYNITYVSWLLIYRIQNIVGYYFLPLKHKWLISRMPLIIRNLQFVPAQCIQVTLANYSFSATLAWYLNHYYVTCSISQTLWRERILCLLLIDCSACVLFNGQRLYRVFGPVAFTFHTGIIYY